MKSDCTGSEKATILMLATDDAPTVLDVGCGDGEKTFHLARHVEWSVGIDPDENLIQTAKNKYSSSNLMFQVAQAESLCFSDSSFVSVLFNESLHHVRVDKQIEALKESHRVLKPEGKLLITEPIYGSGSLGQILELYNDEKNQKQSAVKAIKSVINSEFELSVKKEILIEYHCKGFNDLYEFYGNSKPYTKWNEDKKQDIMDRLIKCNRTLDGDFVIDYFASVWLLRKK